MTASVQSPSAGDAPAAPPGIERRVGPPIARRFSDGPRGKFTGYASVFGIVDTYGDIVAPGAFAATLNEHRAGATRPALLWQHDIAEPIGTLSVLAEDQVGLRVAGELTLEVEQAREARALMLAGALGLSIGFQTRSSSLRKGGGRVLENIKLWEVSVVSIPANAAALITSVKASAFAPEIKSAREFERFLISAGFPRSFAKAVVSRGWSAACRPVGQADVIRRLRSAAAEFRTIAKGSKS